MSRDRSQRVFDKFVFSGLLVLIVTYLVVPVTLAAIGGQLIGGLGVGIGLAVGLVLPLVWYNWHLSIGVKQAGKVWDRQTGTIVVDNEKYKTEARERFVNSLRKR